MQKNQKKKLAKNKRQLNDYVKYSTIAFQMIAIVLIGVFGGIKLDEVIAIDFPVFTFVFSILSVIFAVYYAIKDLINIK